MAITSLGDRSPEHLLSYMQGLRCFAISGLLLSADDGDLEALAVKATRMMKEAVVKKKRIERVNAVSSRDDPGEIDAVSNNAAKDKTDWSVPTTFVSPATATGVPIRSVAF